MIWTSNGGLRSEIKSFFELETNSDGLQNRVGHTGNIIFYYAIFAGAVAVALPLLHWISSFIPKLAQWLPDYPQVWDWLLQLVQHLLIFLGIYVYLLHKDGGINGIMQRVSSSKRSSFFPFGTS